MTSLGPSAAEATTLIHVAQLLGLQLQDFQQPSADQPFNDVLLSQFLESEFLPALPTAVQNSVTDTESQPARADLAHLFIEELQAITDADSASAHDISELVAALIPPTDSLSIHHQQNQLATLQTPESLPVVVVLDRLAKYLRTAHTLQTTPDPMQTQDNNTAVLPISKAELPALLADHALTQSGQRLPSADNSLPPAKISTAMAPKSLTPDPDAITNTPATVKNQTPHTQAVVMDKLPTAPLPEKNQTPHTQAVVMDKLPTAPLPEKNQTPHTQAVVMDKLPTAPLPEKNQTPHTQATVVDKLPAAPLPEVPIPKPQDWLSQSALLTRIAATEAAKSFDPTAATISPNNAALSAAPNTALLTQTVAHLPVASSTSTTTMLSTAHTNLLDTPLSFTQSHWDQQLGRQLVLLAQQRMGQAEIKLNPPHLGPLKVQLSFQKDQAHVIFIAHDGAVRDAIEHALPRLSDMLDTQGIQLNKAWVSDQSLLRQQQGERSPAGWQVADQSDDSSADESEPQEDHHLSETTPSDTQAVDYYV